MSCLGSIMQLAALAGCTLTLIPPNDDTKKNLYLSNFFFFYLTHPPHHKLQVLPVLQVFILLQTPISLIFILKSPS
jgi:hypothetical protein